MPIYNIHLATPLLASFRTAQVAGMFDLPLDQLEERLAHSLTAELPGLDEDWTIGAIVGPSGSGKTTLARAAYGKALYEPQPWPDELPIIECLDAAPLSRRDYAASRSWAAGLSIVTLKDLLRVLTAVGLSSPPSWLKPYRVLSTGERFRADLARALVQIRIPQCPLLVFDEFTSTLDRTTACTASAALAKFLRSEGSGFRVQGSEANAPSSSLNPEPRTLNPLRFVALSCHTDILPWLAPDWILDLTDELSQMTNDKGQMTKRPHWPRGALQRPSLRLAVRRVPQALWPRFARHHYLSGGLSTAATCYAAFLEQGSGFRVQGSGADVPSSSLNPEPRTLNPLPVAFCAALATLGWKRTKRITRLVVLPEFQGLAIGPRLAETVADHEAAKGNRITITASHPAVVAWCSHSPRWRYVGLKKTGSTRQQLAGRTIRCSTGRAVASFEYVGRDA